MPLQQSGLPFGLKKVHFDLPRGNFPRLVLLGNSNVGKSSLTKLLLSEPSKYKGHIGKHPGSTVRLTIIDDPELNHHVIDLPGFGKMLRISKELEDEVQDQIIHYIEADAKNIFLAVFIVSAERIVDELDKWHFENSNSLPLSIEFVQFLNDLKVPCVVVFNKIDKLNQYQQQQARAKFQEVLESYKISIVGPKAESGLLEIINTSVKDETGIGELKAIVNQRAAKLNLNKYDPRNLWMKYKPVDFAMNKAAKKAAREKEAIKDPGFHITPPKSKIFIKPQVKTVSKKTPKGPRSAQDRKNMFARKKKT